METSEQQIVKEQRLDDGIEIEDIIKSDSEQHAMRYAQMGADTDVLSYMSQIEIPLEYREEYTKFRPYLTRQLKLANIKREDLRHYDDLFDVIEDYYRVGLPEDARRFIRKGLSKLLTSSSVNGFAVRQANTRRSEHAIENARRQDPADQEKKKRRLGFFPRR